MKTLLVTLTVAATAGLAFAAADARADQVHPAARAGTVMLVHGFRARRAPAIVHRRFFFYRPAWRYHHRHFYPRLRFRRFHNHLWSGRVYRNRAFAYRPAIGGMRYRRRW